MMKLRGCALFTGQFAPVGSVGARPKRSCSGRGLEAVARGLLAVACVLLGLLGGATRAVAQAQAPPGFGTKTLEEWVADLEFKRDFRVRRRAAVALGWMGPDAAPAVGELVVALRDDASAVRREAAWALAQIGPDARAATPALIRALGDNIAEVRQNAVRALGAIGADASVAVPKLKRALKDKHLAAESAVALGSIGAAAKSALPALRG